RRWQAVVRDAPAMLSRTIEDRVNGGGTPGSSLLESYIRGTIREAPSIQVARAGLIQRHVGLFDTGFQMRDDLTLGDLVAAVNRHRAQGRRDRAANSRR